ncbi:MAG: molybdopterin dinucleotide binding domain-containing protein [Candidatus Odinarchaeota archaeon]
MALRDFLYPQIEARLILARALDADVVQVSEGTLAKEYEKVAAQITLSTRDAQRLNVNEGDFVEVGSKVGTVVVAAKLKEDQPERIVVMQPSPWAYAVIESMIPSQGTTVTIKPSKGPLTKIKELP